MPLIDFQRQAEKAEVTGSTDSAAQLFASAYDVASSPQALALAAGALVIGACLLSKGRVGALGSALESSTKPLTIVGELEGVVGTAARVAEHAPITGKVEGVLIPSRGALAELSEAAVGLTKRGGRVANVKTILREVQPQDVGQMDAIATQLKVGKWTPGGWTTVMEAEGRGVVGYVGTGNNMVSDCAVLPEFRNRSMPLLNRLFAHMKEEGGTWGAHVRSHTSGRLLDMMEKRGRVEVLRRDWSPLSTREFPTAFVSFKFHA